MAIFEVSYTDIERLNPVQLTKLLKKLLLLETKRNGLMEDSVDVPLKITVPDGGEDGRIEWIGGIDSIPWVPHRLTLFQCKAETDMSKADFGNANLSVGKIESGRKTAASKTTGAKKRSATVPKAKLKPQVEEVLDAGGAYIFFYSKHLTKSQKTARIGGIREALELVGRPDAHTVKIDIYDANKISDWANQNLAAIVEVCRWNKRDIPFSFQTVESWQSYAQHQLLTFVEDVDVKKTIEALRGHLQQPKAVARILGNPGLGKSRMAIETLAQPDQLRSSVVYVDAASQGNDLPSVVRQYRQRHDSAVFVVDNCNLDLHQQLRREITHDESKLSLLTIDFDPVEQTGCPATDVLIFLAPAKDTVIRALLEQVFGKSLPPHELERIVRFSNGYPQVAALIAQDRQSGRPDAGSLNDDQLLERLVWGRKPRNDEAFDVLTSCSLFSRIGFEEGSAVERIFVAEQCCGINKDKFYGHAQDFILRRIVQRRGNFIIVVPAPLAVRLAADWWRRCPREKADLLVTGVLPGNLSTALCEQIKMLHYLPEIKEITKELCGDQSPFGSAEVLNTERGSLLFRALAEVSPQDGVRGLKSAFNSNWSREQLLTVGAGRRNLIWALEKLCFWEDTFLDAATMLLRFAAAENETWGNNATGQFVQLYQLYLSGTQAPLALRVQVLENALESRDEAMLTVVLKAAERAFHIGSYNRMGGVEVQGSRPVQQDYRPTTGAEIITYWTACIRIFAEVCRVGGDELRSLAFKEFERIIYPCLSKHFLEPLREAVSDMIKTRSDFWYGARQNLDFAIRNSRAKFSEEEQQTISGIYDLLKPNTIKDKLKLWVTDASWDYMHLNKSGEVVNDAVPEMVKLAQECAKNWDDFKQAIPQLFCGEQRNTFAFGQELSQYRHLQDQLLLESEHSLKALEGKASVSFLSGLLTKLGKTDRTLVANLLDRFADDQILRHYVVRLTASLTPNEHDLDRCIKVLADPSIMVEDFVVLSYGQTLSNVPPPIVAAFCTQLASPSPEGRWTGLMILAQYCYREDDKWNEVMDTFRQLILGIHLIEEPNRFDSVMANHTWEETSEKLLKATFDSTLAMHLVEQIIGVCQAESESIFHRFDDILKKLLLILLAEPYLPLVWSPLAGALTSDDWRLKLHMEWLLGDHFKDDDDPPGLLFSLPEDFLFEWSKTAPQAAQVLARSVPVIVDVETNIGKLEAGINPFALRLIDEHGSDESFLSSLTVNIGSFGGWGSNTPRYRARVSLFSKLAKHRLQAVREWASKEQESAKAMLDHSEKVDEERDAGIFDRF